MDELFVKTISGLSPIERQIVDKYSLRKGFLSPFMRFPIVDSNNDATPKVSKPELSESDSNDQVFTTAEAIDIAAGVDS